MAGAEGSPVMSPAGSPSGAAGQQIDGAENKENDVGDRSCIHHNGSSSSFGRAEPKK